MFPHGGEDALLGGLWHRHVFSRVFLQELVNAAIAVIARMFELRERTADSKYSSANNCYKDPHDILRHSKGINGSLQRRLLTAAIISAARANILNALFSP
jgi:hypothetical protein